MTEYDVDIVCMNLGNFGKSMQNILKNKYRGRLNNLNIKIQKGWKIRGALLELKERIL